ncbi:cartilage matrix protein-like [Littorina saxatilis]|uniref:VWFA domain-containing protein n=1 Tax=Littorina saxatilis TaxID=31220 RepID=A0AAN9C3C5_9CAEN
MGPALVFCVIFCVLQPALQYSLGDREHMVSEAWSDDILTDGWNGVPRGCGGKPADVYLVMDTADGSPAKAVEERKRYLSDLSALFYLHKSFTRVGIVTYGHTPVLTTPLGAHVTLPEVQKAVQETPRVGGSRNTAQALNYLRLSAFSPAVARQGVAHVVILMTNGNSADDMQLSEEATLLRKQGVYIYAVSSTASGHMDKRELHELASSPLENFVYTSDDWNIVDSLIDLLHIKECNYQVLPPLPGKEAVCTSRRPTELLFAVEHLAMGSRHTQLVVTFIQHMLAELDPDSDIQAAMVTSKDPISRRFASSRDVQPVQKVERTLGRVVFPDLGSLLKRARRALTRNSATRAQLTNASRQRLMDVQRVLVVFMDDNVQLTKSALAAARANRRHKLDTYVVYVGEDGKLKDTADEVALLANGEGHVIRVPSYDQLQSQSTVLDTLRTVCTGL